MANVQRGQLKVDNGIGVSVPVDSNVVQLPSSGGQQAMDSVAQTLSGIAGRVSDMADKAAAIEGQEAGKIAGLDPEFRTATKGTIRGDAYNAAGLQVAEAQWRQMIEHDFGASWLKHAGDPAGLLNDLKARETAVLSHAPPELHADLKLLMQGKRLAYGREQARQQAAKAEADARMALDTHVGDLMTGIVERAASLGLDGDADKVLEGDIANLRTALGRSGPSGQPLVSPKEQVKILSRVMDNVAIARTEGALSRLPSAASRDQFLDEAGVPASDDGSDGQDSGDLTDEDLGIVDVPDAGGDRFNPPMRLGGPKEGDAAPAPAPARKGDAAVLGTNEGRARLAARSRELKMRDKIVKARLETEARTVVKLMTEGYEVAPERIASLRLGLSYGGVQSDKLLRKLDIAEGVMRTMAGGRKARPSEIDAFIRGEEDRMRREGADAVGLSTIKAMEKLASKQRTWLARDPAGWADRVGLMPATEIDLSSRETAAKTMTARIHEAEAVAQYYRQKPQYLRPHQKAALAAKLAEGGDVAIAASAAIAEAAGPKAEAIFKELSDEAPMVARLGGMVAKTGITAAAKDAADGIALSKTEGFKTVAPPAADARRLAGDVTSGALGGLPRDESAYIDMANSIYEIRARRYGKTEFDEKLWKQGLKEAIGERTIGRDTFGGISQDRVPVVLPSYVKQDAWGDVKDMLSEEDLRQAGLDMPVGLDGSAIPFSRIKNGTLVQIGDGKFAVSLGDPMEPGSEKWVSRIVPGEAKTRPGMDGLFVIDMHKLAPILAKRRPDFFDPETLPEDTRRLQFVPPMRLGAGDVAQLSRTTAPDQFDGVQQDGIRRPAPNPSEDFLPRSRDEMGSERSPGTITGNRRLFQLTGATAAERTTEAETFVESEIKARGLDKLDIEDALAELGRQQPTDGVLEAIDFYAKKHKLRPPWETNPKWLEGGQ